MKKKLLKKLLKNFSVEANILNLYQDQFLVEIQDIFFKFLREENIDLAQDFTKLFKSCDQSKQSEVLIEVAKYLEEFLANLFEIEVENNQLRQKHDDLAIIYQVKRDFVQRIVAKEFKEAPDNFDGFDFLKKHKITSNLSFNGDIDEVELNLAQKISQLPQNELDDFKQYSAWALFSKAGKNFHQAGALFILPQKIDYQNLVKPNQIEQKIDPSKRGFDLCDQGYSLNRNLSESNYCIFCHKQGKDSCRKGICNEAEFKKNPLEIELKGCPLDEKISEMNLLKSQGFSIGALAMAVIDNPMIAGTGHRICNDCMKSCIYQKQDPVNIPQIESRILKDVLALPYGFEIYSLLTRWNPLNIENPLPKPLTGKKILVCGLGPAGYTLSHYLLNQGHEVVAIDGLKIEPLSPEISGIDQFGNKCDFKPIKYIDQIYEPLSSRQLGGFGGVAEYGITVRWDKNFLKIIRLLLERRANFQMFGGIRFGSSITDKLAFETYVFDHIALCIGAGKPNIIDLENNFAKGIRLASDFLMSLQLTGAFKEELFTNLQIRLPIIVIGGGLTAVDTACEAQAYYFAQIKKFAKKIEILGKDKVYAILNDEERLIADEFLRDFEFCCGKISPHFPKVKILYRKKIQDSPAYRLSHEELHKAFEQGIEFIEEKQPKKAILDDFGHIKALECTDGTIYECRSLLIAAGTSPNISPVVEDHLDISLDGKYFSQIKTNSKTSFITKINEKNQAISFFGDLHPNFEGNVVKAMASAKIGAKQIDEFLNVEKSSPDNLFGYHEFRSKITQDFVARIHKIERLSDHVVEITIKAPLLAKNTQVGQIFRLQNLHYFAKKSANQIIAMEGVAVTALDIDQKNGLISGIVLETGGSTSLIRNFKENEPCIFMGPSGKPTNIPKNETVVIIGGGRGNQPLTALAEAFSQNGCQVIFFAGYKKSEYIVRQQRMENSCQQVIFAIEDEKPNLKLFKETSRIFHGNVVEAIKDYFSQATSLDANSQPNQASAQSEIKRSAHNRFCKQIFREIWSILKINIFKITKSASFFGDTVYIDIHEEQKNELTTNLEAKDRLCNDLIDRVFTIGNDNLMHEIAKLRHQNIVPAFKNAKYAITSLNSPMQCMMKGVCAQCLQKRIDQNGKTEYFYSCADQDQNMDNFDFEHLHYRCQQNSLSEKISKMWISYLNSLKK